ncbi:amidohydrolase family protein [Streptomyces sp. NPDC001985]|uniref:hypothetical protein n=1 Tax=Streptomyces sp. NPDC001985 TaxID=3154406 RepID=UPI00332620F6
MTTPLLIHTHGMEDLDYSSMEPDDLVALNDHATARGTDVVPGIFLARNYIGTWEKVVRRYADLRDELPALAGFSVEGPLLGNLGGVPPRGIWSPNADEWERIADLGRYGLAYIVMAPDGGDLDDRIEGGVTYRDVIDLFYSRGVRLALGHFRHSDPQLSADRTAAAIDYVSRRFGPSPSALLTDHLFNDMPRNFRHVWRTREERAQRASQLAEFLADDWASADLSALLGPVPATLVQAAHDGKLLPFLNFDGDHVDLEICRRTLDFLGSEKIIGITDDTERPFLAGEELHQRSGNGLWYRSDGIVAAGTGSFSRQCENLALIGRGPQDIELLFGTNPRRAIAPLSALSETRG